MRSIYCGELNESCLDQEVTLCGWVHRRRDHGGVIFVDLRDHTGLLQVVFDPDTAETFALAESVRNEYVLQVQGRVRRRPEGTVNADMPTGQVEVLGVVLTRAEQRRRPPRSSSMTRMFRRRPACVTVISICAGRRCSKSCACARVLPMPCAAFSMRMVLSM